MEESLVLAVSRYPRLCDPAAGSYCDQNVKLGLRSLFVMIAKMANVRYLCVIMSPLLKIEK